MNNSIHFLNGKFVVEEELLISPRDLGFSRGYAVADFLVTHNLKPFRLSQHIDRLYKSAEIIGLKIPWTKDQVSDWIKETLAKNNSKEEKTIKIFLTGGISHSMYQEENPTIMIVIGSYIRPPASYYENGVKAKAVKYERQFYEAKTTNYIEAIKVLSENKDNGITEVIYYNDSQVFEGGGCNVFAVIDNKLVTPKSNIVEGITRNVLLKILKLDIPIEVRDFTFNELVNASEVFLTGSSKEIRGVVNIDGKDIGSGKVGEITKEASRQYKEYISKPQSLSTASGE
jgi:branched-subunit amino acid aminotransferase/4-amino-4-deoxychorismate lyase